VRTSHLLIWKKIYQGTMFTVSIVVPLSKVTYTNKMCAGLKFVTLINCPYSVSVTVHMGLFSIHPKMYFIHT